MRLQLFAASDWLTIGGRWLSSASCWRGWPGISPTDSGERWQAFEGFVEEHDGLLDYARFRATVESRGETWPNWPQPLRDGVLYEATTAGRRSITMPTCSGWRTSSWRMSRKGPREGDEALSGSPSRCSPGWIRYLA